LHTINSSAQKLSERKKTLSDTSLGDCAGNSPTGLSTGSVDDSTQIDASPPHFHASYKPAAKKNPAASDTPEIPGAVRAAK
jgi:hypothetical protein